MAEAAAISYDTELSNDDLAKAWDQGYTAFLGGHSECPYEEDTELAEEWLDGFYAAKEGEATTFH